MGELSSKETCLHCNGAGRTGFLGLFTCGVCAGSGKVRPCHTCSGSGSTEQTSLAGTLAGLFAGAVFGCIEGLANGILTAGVHSSQAQQHAIIAASIEEGVKKGSTAWSAAWGKYQTECTACTGAGCTNGRCFGCRGSGSTGTHATLGLCLGAFVAGPVGAAVCAGLGSLSPVECFECSGSGCAKCERVYHGTSSSSAHSIRTSGFEASEDGMLGRGVYCSRDYSKAADFGECVLECDVKFGKTKTCSGADKSWHWTYDTAFLPAGNGVK